MSRREDNSQLAWDVEDFVRVITLHLANGWELHPSVRSEVADYAEGLQAKERSHHALWGLGLLIASKRWSLDLVDERGCAAFDAQALRDSDVVAVGVRMNDRNDVFHRAAERRQESRNLIPISGHPAVEDRQMTTFFDRIEVHERATESMDAFGYL